MTEKPREILDRVYALSGPDEAERVYDEWATAYDADTVQGLGYVGPAVAATRLAELTAATDVVLDAGCGTGLAGAELAERADVTIDGVDLSQGMLDQARARGVYRRLDRADLTRRLDIDDDTYDAAICVGTLTDGHVGPAALDELARVVRPGGSIVATVLGRAWEPGGYRAHVDELAAAGVVRVLEAEVRPYHERENIDCRLCVLEVC